MSNAGKKEKFDKMEKGVSKTDKSGKLGENTDEMSKKEAKTIFLGVLLVGMAGIVLETGLTRIFSIALWHHFAFLSIAVALFGLGVSGVYLSLNPDLIGKDPGRNLYKFAWLLSISTLIAFFVFTRLDLDVRNLANPANLLKFALFYLLLALPFFWSGCVMSAVISWKSRIVQKIYFFDLIGAGIGCLAVVFLISLLTGPGVVVLSAVISAAAAVVLMKLSPEGLTKKRISPILLYGAGLLIILPAAARIFPVPLPKDKALYHFTRQGNAQITDSLWNPFSRVDAFYPMPATTWGLSRNFHGKVPPQIGITIDGDGFTSIVNLKGEPKDVEFPLYTLNSLVHRFNVGGYALIIGSGGGIDVLSALCNGTANVDAVEINPSIVKLVTGKYGDFSGQLFQKIGTHLYNAEGRNFIKSVDRKYQLVYLPLVDSWAATHSGAYSLSENFLYTVEAFKDYYNHVSLGGFISFSRWEYLMPEQPNQTYRLCAMAVEATGEDLRKSVVITADGRLVNIIWKKGSFNEEELGIIREFCNTRGFSIIYMPGMDNQFCQVLNPATYKAFIASHPFDISPVTDDRPFFYLFERWKFVGVYLENMLSGRASLPVVFTIVFVILIFSIVFSVIFMILPLYIKNKGRMENQSMSMFMGFMAYFTLLGLAFMFFEITLMTKFTLFLGGPAFSLSVILFSLLMFSGIGSYLGGVSPWESRKTLLVAISSLIIIGILYYLFLDKWFTAALVWGILYRVLLSVVLIAPVGICMGVPFSMGLRRLGEVNSSMIPWAWGVNGCASVLGTVLAMICAQAVGFWRTLLFALFLYFVVWVIFVPISKDAKLSKA